MGKCLNCEIEIKQKEGKRKKKFCSDGCRASYHQKNNRRQKKDPKYKIIPIDEYKELVGYKKGNTVLHGFLNVLEDGSTQVSKLDTPIVLVDRDNIRKQIEEIEKSKAPPYVTTPLGKKVWQNDQNKKISELKKKLL